MLRLSSWFNLQGTRSQLDRAERLNRGTVATIRAFCGFVNTFFDIFFGLCKSAKKQERNSARSCQKATIRFVESAEADAEHLAQQGEQITARTARKHGVDLLVRIRLDQGHA